MVEYEGVLQALRTQHEAKYCREPGYLASAWYEFRADDAPLRG